MHAFGMGLLGEELVGPYDVLMAHGYEIDFMIATTASRLLCPSMEPGYLDPPLDKVVTDEHFAAHERDPQIRPA